MLNPCFAALHLHSAPVHSFWRKAVTTALSPASIEGCVPRLAGIIQASVDGWAQRGSASLLHEVGQEGSGAPLHAGLVIVYADRSLHSCDSERVQYAAVVVHYSVTAYRLCCCESLFCLLPRRFTSCSLALLLCTVA